MILTPPMAGALSQVRSSSLPFLDLFPNLFGCFLGGCPPLRRIRELLFTNTWHCDYPFSNCIISGERAVAMDETTAPARDATDLAQG